MELTDSRKTRLIETAQSLKGSARRLLMARTVQALGPGGPPRAARALRWGRMPMRKGRPELDSSVSCLDALTRRGRKRAEVPLPHLLTEIHAIGESHSQAAPPRRTPRLSPRLTAAAVRRQLSAQKGYAAAALPTAAPSGTPGPAWGDYPQTVAKSQPPKNARTPTLSSTQEPEASRRPLRWTRGDASRGRLRRPSTWGRGPGEARAVGRLAPPPTTCPRRRP